MTDVIDRFVIERFRRDYDDDDGSFLASTVEAFCDEILVFQDATRASATSETELGRRAHRLKSAAGALGALEVVELCLQLESAARNGQRAIAADVLAQLLPALARARVMLARIVESPGRASRREPEPRAARDQTRERA